MSTHKIEFLEIQVTNDKKLNEWTNKDNKHFYESIPPEALQNRSINGGLENGCDIDLIWDYIKEARSVLEIGAGYGRVIRNIINRGYKDKLYAIERSNNLCKVLKDNFGNKTEIYQNDFLNFHFPKKFDLILWLWCGISDFSKLEQLRSLHHLSRYLTPNGMMILDTFPHTIKPPKAIVYKEQEYIIQEDKRIAYGYIPSIIEIKNYAKQAHFNISNHINYVTPTGRVRIMHFLSN